MGEIRLLTWLPVSALLALLVLTVAAPEAGERAAMPIALVGALVGVPHGAVDHLVPLWWDPAAGEKAPRGAGAARVRSLVRFVASYLLIATLALAAFRLAPTPTLVAFLVLSAAHFGRGEVVTSAERAGRPTPHTGQEWPVTTAVGSAVVGLLLWAHPTLVEPYLRPLSPALADALGPTRAVGLLAVAAAVVHGLLVLARARRLLEGFELVLLVATFAVAPPLAAFGVYFGAWHAVRHTGRLLDLARRDEQCHGTHDRGFGGAVTRVARASFWPTAVVLCAMGALWASRAQLGLQSEVVVLLALTFPHVAVVWALDLRTAHVADQPGMPRRARPRPAGLTRSVEPRD